MRIIWKYYVESTIFNIGFSTIIGLLFGLLAALIIFCSFGILISSFAFSYFKNHENYFYYNFGFTRLDLNLKLWKINLAIATPILIVYLLIFNH